MIRGVVVACAAAALATQAVPQSRTLQQGTHRMEIMLERLDGSAWKTIDPGLILAQGDRVRFRFKTNFDGFLYVSNQSTSGKYEQLFPREETGRENRVTAATEYQVPTTDTAFRIAGPAGYETVYWLVSPGRLPGGAPMTDRPATPPIKLTPRCDDAILRARGSCVDSSAGLKLVPRDVELPKLIADAAVQGADLLFMRQADTSVVSSPAPLTGPIVYEFRVAHK